jgi:hypothetical protein
MHVVEMAEGDIEPRDIMQHGFGYVLALLYIGDAGVGVLILDHHELLRACVAGDGEGCGVVAGRDKGS